MYCLRYEKYISSNVKCEKCGSVKTCPWLESQLDKIKDTRDIKNRMSQNTYNKYIKKIIFTKLKLKGGNK